MHSFINTCFYVCTYIFVCSYICTYIHKYILTYTLSHTLTYTHTYTHTLCAGASGKNRARQARAGGSTRHAGTVCDWGACVAAGSAGEKRKGRGWALSVAAALAFPCPLFPATKKEEESTIRILEMSNPRFHRMYPKERHEKSTVQELPPINSKMKERQKRKAQLVAVGNLGICISATQVPSHTIWFSCTESIVLLGLVKTYFQKNDLIGRIIFWWFARQSICSCPSQFRCWIFEILSLN